MKRNLLFLFVLSTMVFSCSKDKSKDIDSTNTIIGTWHAAEFKSADPNNSTLNFGAEILKNLADEECYILSFTFNENLSVVVDNSINYIMTDAIFEGSDIECPNEKDTELSTYTFDGDVLLVVDQDGLSQSIKVIIDGNTMTVDATDLDIPNLNADGSLIFKKA